MHHVNLNSAETRFRVFALEHAGAIPALRWDAIGWRRYQTAETAWLEQWLTPTAILGVVGIVGRWLLGWWRRYRTRRDHFRELIEAIAEECRLSADFRRWQLRYQIGHEQHSLVPAEALEHLASLRERTKEVRARLWKARGYPETSEELTDIERQILTELRQTRRWQMSDEAAKKAAKGRGPE